MTEPMERMIDRELVLRGLTAEQVMVILGALRWIQNKRLTSSDTVLAALVAESREKLSESIAAATVEHGWTQEEMDQMGEEMENVRVTFHQENR